MTFSHLHGIFRIRLIDAVVPSKHRKRLVLRQLHDHRPVNARFSGLAEESMPHASVEENWKRCRGKARRLGERCGFESMLRCEAANGGGINLGLSLFSLTGDCR